MGSKTTIILFIFDLALKKKFSSAGSACTNSKSFAGKNFEIMTKTIQFRISVTATKSPIKITIIHEIENLTLGHL
jgi:hypothetical protein